jgi:hypothetical protein
MLSRSSPKEMTRIPRRPSDRVTASALYDSAQKTAAAQLEKSSGMKAREC